MTLDAAITACSVIAEAALLALVLRRKIWRVLPVFCGYLAWSLVTDVVVWFLLSRSYVSYERFYKAEMASDAVLQLLVLIELGWCILRPALADRGRGAFVMFAGLVALTALVIWPWTSRLVDFRMMPGTKILLQTEDTIVILRVVCLAVLVVFSRVLGLGWKDREFQVGLGLGVYSIVSLIVVVLYSLVVSHWDAFHWLDQLAGVSYIGVVVYWIFSFSKYDGLSPRT